MNTFELCREKKLYAQREDEEEEEEDGEIEEDNEEEDEDKLQTSSDCELSKWETVIRTSRLQGSSLHKEPTMTSAGRSTQNPSNGRAEHSHSDLECVEEELDFNWDEYLEETGATAAAHTSFKHVELSLQSSFQAGMKLEVADRSRADTYWVATVITTCGQLLLLRYCGYGDERSADFWCDVMTAELHPVGWCAQNNKLLQPPEVIKEKYSDWTEFLPLRGKNTVDLIVAGCVLEIRDATEPFVCWPAQVKQNVGGRLWLSYVGLEEPDYYIWIFYLDVRLRPMGWAKENCLTMEPPKELRDLRSATEWSEALEKAMSAALEKPLPLEVFKVYNEYYFLVTVDDLSSEALPCSVLCHADSPGILPVQWCLKNGVSLQRPRGFQSQDFDWADYLKHTGTEAAPDACFPNASVSRGFCKDTWLEAVNPLQPGEINVARITQVKGRLLWLRYEGLTTTLPECIADVESMDIFPVGWCEANAYQLTPLRKAVCQSQRKIAVVQPEKQLILSPKESVELDHCQSAAMDTVFMNGKYCCSQIFVNHRCFSGPYLNKGRIAELPQAVGPGKCSLVLKEDSDDFDEEEEEEESYSGESCSLEVPLSLSTRRSRACRSLTLPGTETSTQQPTLRRSTRSLSYTHNQAVQHTHSKTAHTEEEESRLVLERNPLEWSVSDVVNFIMSTDCASLAKTFQEQEIDGQALLLLTLPTVQECMDLKLGPAIKLCHQIERVKVAFYSQYAK
ncbi:Scm-like with four MBT domains protein 2 [Bagarius yarrelli]|uniref:Scm-like with four MBT domains protein 2 n=1 Tax=Bagarius yarrelli TaxID=175774 RepID=A0A556TH27_BAGYA|nr:Scm-like with four MBT domains protein 2 [Bagarius yarrelli]